MKARCQRRTPSGQNAAHLWHDATGAIAIEYGLIAALVALAILGSLVQLGEAVLGLPLESLVDAFLDALS